MSYLHSTTFFFFNPTPTTEIYTLSLHDALPIWQFTLYSFAGAFIWSTGLAYGGYKLGENYENIRTAMRPFDYPDRKSTRLNSSHVAISYAVFCLKKKKIHLELNPLITHKNTLDF